MTNFIKHFITNDGGRFAVAIDGDMFVLSHLTGPAPRPGHLYLAIQAWPALQAAANAAAASRQNPYDVERREGMSGAVDYRLRECRDTVTGDFPVRATVHVSMYGKLNQKIRIWLGDLPPMCWSLFANHPVREDQTVREVEVYRPAWRWQATPLYFEMGEDGLAVSCCQEPADEEFVAWALLAALDEEDAA